MIDTAIETREGGREGGRTSIVGSQEGGREEGKASEVTRAR